MDNERTKLEKYTIHELRELGRSYGVKSPASRTKDDLIAQITAIIAGNVKPVSTRRGRPTKKRGIENWLSHDDGQTSRSMFALNDAELDYSADAKTVRGFVRITAESYGVLITSGFKISGADIYIKPETIRKYALLPGDEVECEVLNSKNGAYVVTEILSVGGDSADKFRSRRCFSEIVAVYPDSRIDMSSADNSMLVSVNSAAPIAYGQRIAFVFENRSNFGETFAAFADFARGAGVAETVFIAQPAEAESGIVKNFSDSLYTMYDSDPADGIDAVRFALDKCKRRLEYGKNAFLIFDVDKYVSAYTPDITEGMLAAAKLIGSGRNTENGSLTVVAFMTEKNFEPFADLFTNFIYVPAGADECDSTRSYSRNAKYYV